MPLQEESKQLLWNGDVPYDNFQCPYQEPVQGKVYNSDHYVRGDKGENNARPLNLWFKIWSQESDSYDKYVGRMKLSRKDWDYEWFAGRYFPAARILK